MEPTPVAKSGWKTTEAWLAFLVCGILTYGGADLLAMVKVLLANPALPPWVAPLAMLAPAVLGGIIAKASMEYGKLRRDLKLGDSSTAQVAGAVAAGAAAGTADPAAVVAAANK